MIYSLHTERERICYTKGNKSREANKAGGSNEPHVSFHNNRPNCFPYLFKTFFFLPSEINPDIYMYWDLIVYYRIEFWSRVTCNERRHWQTDADLFCTHNKKKNRKKERKGEWSVLLQVTIENKLLARFLYQRYRWDGPRATVYSFLLSSLFNLCSDNFVQLQFRIQVILPQLFFYINIFQYNR